MGRKNRTHHLPQGRGFSPDHEKRNNKVLKAFRKVHDEDSLSIAGIVRDVFADNEHFPGLASVPARHLVFVLDPRIVKREFSSGFRAGYNFGRARERTTTAAERQPDEIKAKVGRVVLLGPKDRGRRILAAYIESRPLHQERKDLYGELALAGLRGFDRREHKTPPAPIMVLAHLDRPVHDPSQRNEVARAVEDAIYIHQAREFTLGELVVATSDR